MSMTVTSSAFYAGQLIPAKYTCERSGYLTASARNKRRRRCKNLAQGGGLAEPWVLIVKKRVALTCPAEALAKEEGAKESVRQKLPRDEVIVSLISLVRRFPCCS
jgi:hypothetical protein